MNASRILRASSLAATLGATLSAQAIVFVDDFGATQGTVVNSAASGLAEDSGFAFAPNVTRTLGTFNDANTFAGVANSKSSIRNGLFSGASDSEVGAAIFVRYDFATPANFSGTTDFRVFFQSNDIPDVVTIRGRDANNVAFSMSKAVPIVVFYHPAQIQLLANFGAADAKRISSIELGLGRIGEPPAGRDFQITQFNAVPEPASMCALGLGALALLRRRRA